jgi:hypothetical protein
MTTVHDLSEEISEIGIWNLLVVGKIVMKNISADLKITIVEVVLSGPSLGSELSSTQDQGMEHAESEQEGLVLTELVGFSSLEVRLVELAESSSDVRLKILWSLIGNFKSILENGLWDDLLLWKTWWL